MSWFRKQILRFRIWRFARKVRRFNEQMQALTAAMAAVAAVEPRQPRIYTFPSGDGFLSSLPTELDNKGTN